MSIIRRNNPYPGMLNLFDDLIARDLFNWGTGNNSSTNTTIPAVNIKETNDHFEVEMAAPGMSKDDFKIELDGNTLIITREKQQQREEKENERYTQKEFSYQSFQRTFQLSKDVVDLDKIQARDENGVLNLVIPKKRRSKTKATKNDKDLIVKKAGVNPLFFTNGSNEYSLFV
jgi:HSP20 family protein